MTRQEWLSRMRIGEQVLIMCSELELGEDGTGLVAGVQDDEIIVYVVRWGTLEHFNLPDGTADVHLIPGVCRIEPLSEWRKEPPDERGWWWCYRVLGPEPFLREMFAVHCVNEHDEWGFWVPSGYIKAPLAGDCFWQKAHVPTPPMDEETDSSRAIPGE